MKKIGFIGAFDKIDTVIYIAKIIKELGNKVLVVDATILQKAKYIIPAINPTKSYVTNFEGIDIAVGFFENSGIENYLGLEKPLEEEYDYILFDIDTTKICKSFDIQSFTTNYFVTSFDLYSLKKGITIIGGLNEKIELRKVLFSDKNSKKDNEYLDYLSRDCLIEWKEPKIYFPLKIEDLITLANNQRVEKIKFQKLSKQYKSSIIYIVEEICDKYDSLEIVKVFKKIERGA